ncbi:hypothetical protein [Streptomyces poonensis]|uniref:Uncharacterized protein n=1 Tax=Streptomyces poonensis TaxID=68255 RepID=A0A918QF71_9ACTN|nr:hypothetical protein [Streptomyces poonensis]GGZ44603.1 hypothetical protein GCM10010365_76180 [Streptomyces poonensis]GLJ93537.1 hypothetical protein GCM10017589_61510 [Streptomyces poonensis]
MSLRAAEFFTELCLPFTDSTVVGNTYYAAPVPGGPLRLRISFTGTVYADTYGGLRAAVIHADRGEIDAVALSFVDHGTFHRRDEARNTSRDSSKYGTFDKYHRPGQPPWEGAVTTGLRDAIEQYTRVWFPGVWEAASPVRAVGRSAGTTVLPPPARPSVRSR